MINLMIFFTTYPLPVNEPADLSKIGQVHLLLLQHLLQEGEPIPDLQNGLVQTRQERGGLHPLLGWRGHGGAGRSAVERVGGALSAVVGGGGVGVVGVGVVGGGRGGGARGGEVGEQVPVAGRGVVVGGANETGKSEKKNRIKSQRLMSRWKYQFSYDH